jgi:uncharacterized protein (DUF1778 family)
MDNTAHKGQPGGRPRKDTQTLRDAWLRARVRKDELHRIEQLARDANKSLSDYVRETALTARIVIKRHRVLEPVFLHDVSRMAQEISRVGNVINQVALIANTVGDIRRAAILDDAHKELRGLVAEIRPLLQRLHELQ